MATRKKKKKAKKPPRKTKTAAKKARAKKKRGDAETEKMALAVLQVGPKSNKELRDKLKKDPALDRTLQRLRRKGRIKIVKNRWTVAEAKLCPKCKGRGFVVG